VKAISNPLKTELMKRRKVTKETNAKTWTLSKDWREMNTCRYFISHVIDVSNELDADFNFPKIHWMSQWVEQNRPYRALQQYSAESHEQA